MSKARFTVQTLMFVILTLAFNSLAQAQATRTWVSGVGDDVNPCSRTAPCKTFAGAISKTFINGEIDTLDPGGFGAITITKSITIDGTGTFGSILASGTNGVNINIAVNVNDPLRTVRLRGLSINGAGASGAVGTRTGIQGININTNGANQVFIEDCVVSNFSQNGLLLSNIVGNSSIYVKNTVFRDNGGDGIQITSNDSDTIKLTLDDVHLTGNANGLHARTGARVVARNSVFNGNTTNGVFMDAATTGFGSASIWASQISLNGANGVRVGNTGNVGSNGVVLSENQIDRNTGNGVLISVNGVIETFSNNSIRGNGADGCVGCTPVGPGS